MLWQYTLCVSSKYKRSNTNYEMTIMTDRQRGPLHALIYPSLKWEISKKYTYNWTQIPDIISLCTWLTPNSYCLYLWYFRRSIPLLSSFNHVNRLVYFSLRLLLHVIACLFLVYILPSLRISNRIDLSIVCNGWADSYAKALLPFWLCSHHQSTLAWHAAY